MLVFDRILWLLIMSYKFPTIEYYDRRPYNTVLLKFSAHWIVIVQTIYIKRLSRALIFETLDPASLQPSEHILQKSGLSAWHMALIGLNFQISDLKVLGVSWKLWGGIHERIMDEIMLEFLWTFHFNSWRETCLRITLLHYRSTRPIFSKVEHLSITASDASQHSTALWNKLVTPVLVIDHIQSLRLPESLCIGEPACAEVSFAYSIIKFLAFRFMHPSIGLVELLLKVNGPGCFQMMLREPLLIDPVEIL